MEYDADAAIRRYRIAPDRLLAGRPSAPWIPFVDPGEGRTVLAEEFLSHLNLGRPEIHAVLREACPYLDRNPGLKAKIHARLRFVARMNLHGYNQLLPARRGSRDMSRRAQACVFTRHAVQMTRLQNGARAHLVPDGADRLRGEGGDRGNSPPK